MQRRLRHTARLYENLLAERSALSFADDVSSVADSAQEYSSLASEMRSCASCCCTGMQLRRRCSCNCGLLRALLALAKLENAAACRVGEVVQNVRASVVRGGAPPAPLTPKPRPAW
ncbi:hypothetical protein ABL78_0710 [Leptomonas seymouri]|uniref:Uncharacterized protein n=1 Tax=Leptomonas seymouri TaxID=5684 RepID=A0A0N1I8E9_LEPSE|nr:hypothetical protein ABL78_0710 [Leptomonas seymouri]|eukprot:KPI90192.1 hypothetical protein ABL78_0710 [Leptomonas seymouri]